MSRWTVCRTGPPWAALLLALACCAGCGKSLTRAATEQLLTSDAVDRSVARMDFSDLTGKKVFFDVQYLQHIKGAGFVNAEYIVSSMRQQMLAADVLIQDKKEDADYVVEVRVGALGTDGNEVVYGIPANNALNAASTVVPGTPPLPTIPELALAKRNDQMGAAKIAAFAYNQKSRHPVWQSGIQEARSTARDNWFFGVGPFQSGTIHEDGPRFAGEKLAPFGSRKGSLADPPLIAYREEHHFIEPMEIPEPAPVQVAEAPAPAAEPPASEPPPTEQAAAPQPAPEPMPDGSASAPESVAAAEASDKTADAPQETASETDATPEPMPHQPAVPEEGWKPPRRVPARNATWEADRASAPFDEPWKVQFLLLPFVDDGLLPPVAPTNFQGSSVQPSR